MSNSSHLGHTPYGMSGDVVPSAGGAGPFGVGFLPESFIPHGLTARGRKRSDLTGRQFGSWTALYEVPRLARYERRWMCLCVCGAERPVLQKKLINKRSKSCGCQQAARSVPPKFPNAPWAAQVFKVLRRRARYRGIEWGMSREAVVELSARPCHYCHAPPGHTFVHRQQTYRRSTLDRLDSSKGYVEGNVVPCCLQCNHAKSTMSAARYVAWLNGVVERRRTTGEENDAA